MFTRYFYCTNCDKSFKMKFKKLEQLVVNGYKINVHDISKKYFFQEFLPVPLMLGTYNQPFQWIKNPLKRQACIDSKKQYEDDIKIIKCPNCKLESTIKILTHNN